ncbi:MAG: hypothetical protein GEU75_06260 [Dehalococcoidia bacterium]|nr:hypothetical protein [Dehalococcoidia bacterium]
MPSAGAPPERDAGGLDDWEIETAKVVVAVFLQEQDVFDRHDREDLLHECLIHWLAVRGNYVAARGASVRTYMRRVLRHKLADLLDRETAQKRGGQQRPLSLDAPGGPSAEEDDDPLADSVADASIAGDTEAEAEQARLSERLQQFREDLAPGARQLFDALLREGSMAKAAHVLRQPRSNLYRVREEIARMAREQGLDEFLD